jgi:hypothetical protein
MDFNINFPKKKTSDGSGDDRPWYVKYMGLLIAGFALLVVLISGISWKISTTNEGNRIQNELNAQYRVNYDNLSKCVIQIREAANVAKGETAAFDQIISDAVKGGPQGGDMILLLRQQMPDLNTVGSTFNKVLEITAGCRSDYHNLVTKLNSQLNGFDNWRNGSVSGNLWAGSYPTNGLEAAKGEKLLKGQAALDQMKLIITPSTVRNAQESGNIEAEDPFAPTTTVKSGG